jgi:hypothetical protein
LGPDDFLVESPLERTFDHTRPALWMPSDAVVDPFPGELGKHAEAVAQKQKQLADALAKN